VGLNSLKSLNLTNVYPNNNNKNNKVKSKHLELFELAGKNLKFQIFLFLNPIIPFIKPHAQISTIVKTS
jgi:hypothetical protein